MLSISRIASSAVVAAMLLFAAPAFALTLEVTHSGPSVVGEAHAFTAVVSEATGTVTLEWKFGENEDFQPGGLEASHAFSAPGFYAIDVLATDSNGDVTSAYFQHLVHHPLTPLRPTSSTSIVYDSARNRVYSLNSDNDSVTAIDPDRFEKVAELAVYQRPESLALTPEGKLWVVHQDDYAVAVVDLDRFVVESGFRLPYASQPVALAVSPTGDAAYVSLLAVGKLLKLDPKTGAVIGEAAVGPTPRGIAVSHDGKDVYVTRFISPDAGGEVVKVDAASMQVATRVVLKLDAETEDSDQRARGVPNYLFSVALTPDGRLAWVPGKKDNILRGKLRDGQSLTHDTTVRPLVAIIDALSSQEIYENRVDLDDRSLPVHVDFTPLGNLAIVTLGGSNRIEVRDVNRPTEVFSAIADAGLFPRATVLAPNGRLFVQGTLSRDVRVFDVSKMLNDFDKATPPLLATIPTVTSEKLPADILAGKKLFHDAGDPRMALEGYLSCVGCHFDGLDDGRVYDFSDNGEGLRNTLALAGRAGTRQGRLNWSGNFDEVQDFEHQIRGLFSGTGFMPDEVFHSGTRDQRLGDAKAGLSPELDALAAYVTSLDRVSPSPYRNADGSLSPDGLEGKALFEKLGCDFCHGGADFTDSARGRVHDVGTITASSGTGSEQPLSGLDTPTLLGVWATAPYLHDGSAPTLRDVLTTRNASGLHGFVASLSSQQLDQLVAYLQQIDGEPPARRLPFDPPAPDNMMPNGGAAGAAGAAGAGGSGQAPAANASDSSASSTGCACRVVPGASGVQRWGSFGEIWSFGSLWGLVLAAVVRRRTRARLAPIAAAAAFAALAFGSAGCAGAEEDPSDAAGPADWSKLPAVTHADPELSPLGSREQTLERICARGRGDSFALSLCSAPRAEIRGMTDLLALAGLGESRAFALTGNSTSLVAQSVSAINPRILVFPRVEDELTRPATMSAVGFVRGEQFAEIVSRDLTTGDLNFYLLGFEQRCSYDSAGCDLKSLLTDEIERDWTAYSVYDHDDLEGTSFDCLSCHRPGGLGTKRILRMQELSSPWTHWFPQRFAQQTESDRVLLAQFSATHQHDAQYGGIPLPVIVNAIDEGSGAQLETFLRSEGFGDQPNVFDASIAREIQNGSSPTWQARFDAHLRGEAIAVPYPLIDVTDEAKRSAAMRSYQDVVLGAAPRESLLDLRAIFSDDAQQKLSFVPAPAAEGRTVLLQMCGRCHDGRGNPELLKNKFNVLRLEEVPRTLKDFAIARISDPGMTRMPPWRSGNLTAEGRQAALLELQK